MAAVCQSQRKDDGVGRELSILEGLFSFCSFNSKIEKNHMVCSPMFLRHVNFPSQLQTTRYHLFMALKIILNVEIAYQRM
jgi:hypothetical protein